MERTHDSSGVLITDEQNRVLLVHQNYGKRTWSLPGGVVEAGESVWEAALRECKEEVNIEPKNIELAGLYFMSHRNGYIYVFKTNEYKGTIEIDHKEIDDYGFFSINELPRPITNFTVERIMDAISSDKTIFKEQNVRDYRTLE